MEAHDYETIMNQPAINSLSPLSSSENDIWSSYRYPENRKVRFTFKIDKILLPGNSSSGRLGPDKSRHRHLSTLQIYLYLSLQIRPGLWEKQM